jgi:hypothetical protein
MPHLTTTTAAILAAAALVPAAAMASDVELRGAPTLRQAGAHTATLTFAVDDRLPRRDDGGLAATVKFREGASSIASWGRHGHDYKYRSTVRTGDALVVGKKYRVRIVVAGQRPIVRLVKLHPAQGD